MKSITLELLEQMWNEANEAAHAAIDANDSDAADRHITRQEVIADLIDELKEDNDE